MNEKSPQHNWAYAMHLANMALAMAQPKDAADALHLLRSKMAEGVEKYIQFKRMSYERIYDVVWQSGSTRLLRFMGKNKKPVLFIPSFINRWHILDLLPDFSCVQSFIAKGHTVYVVDWGSPTPHDHALTIDDLILRRLLPIFRTLEETHKNYSAIGYCLGGTLLAGALARWPQHQTKLTQAAFLASPWDFHAGSNSADWRMASFHAFCKPIITQLDHMPVQLVQAGFAAIDPALWAKKYIQFFDQNNAAQLDIFVATEDWLNDPVPLAKGVALQLIDNFYTLNEPHTGVWQLGFEPVNLTAVTIPCLVVEAQDDRIVPFASSHALADALPQAHNHTVQTGHIGMMTSRQNAPKLWANLQKFLSN